MVDKEEVVDGLQKTKKLGLDFLCISQLRQNMRLIYN